MSDDALTADTSSEAVEELLRQLVDARFVLTDREGAVTRWSRPAEELFGWPGARMLGRPLVKTLGLPDSLPPSGGQLETVVRRKDGQELEVAMALVPVRMSQSLEFNGFLEALEIAAPRGDALSQLGRSHRTVVEWIQAALEGNAHLDDDGLAAGTIVAFRPLNEPPAGPPPERDESTGQQERLVSLEAAEAGFESELADTRRVLEEMRAQVESLRGEVEQTQSDRAEQERAEREWLQRELDDMRAAVSTLEAARTVRSELAEAQARLEQVEAASGSERATLEAELDETRSRMEGIERSRSQEHEELRSELAGTHARLEELATARAPDVERLEAQLAEAGEQFRQREHEREEERHGMAGELAETRAKLEVVEREVADGRERGGDDPGLSAEVADLRARLGELAESAGRQAELAAELDETRAHVEALRSGVLERGADDAELRTVAAQVQASAEAVREAKAAIERLAGRAEKAAEAANGHSANANDAAGAAEARATRAEQAAQVQEAVGETLAAVEGEAASARELASEMLGAVDARASEARAAVEQLAERAESAAAAADAEAGRSSDAAGSAAGNAARALEASGAAEGHADRARESSGLAEGHATRASERAGEAESHARRIAEAVATAERRAAEAEEAAAGAAEAAELARRSAAEAGSEAESVRRAAEDAAPGRGHETPARTNGGAPADEHGAHRPLFGRKRDLGPQRELRTGFDDVSHPMATMGLNGHFRELNQAFCDLVGHSEEEFHAAVWPPVMDRPNLPKHREQMKHLLEGRIDSADFDTGYVHAQGLLVPLAGTITLVELEGSPDHFMLDVHGHAG